MVEFYNQQYIYIWIRYHIRITSVQRGLYTDWDIHKACEMMILMKSIYSELLEEFGVP